MILSSLELYSISKFGISVEIGLFPLLLSLAVAHCSLVTGAVLAARPNSVADSISNGNMS